MVGLNSAILKDYNSYLKKVKFKSQLQELKLELNSDECPHIYLAVIKVRKQCRNQGVGTKVMSELTRYADKHNIQIRLYAASIFGSDLKRLYSFYRRFGFILIKKNKDGYFIRKPKKNIKKIAIKSKEVRIFV